MAYRSVFTTCFAVLLWLVIPALSFAQRASSSFTVTGYYAGPASRIDSFEIEKLTHIIYSFCHLQGNRLHVSNAGDTLTIQRLVALKSRKPQLKVLLSLGGWGGCKTCSPVFATAEGRKEFALSVKELLYYFKADGLDLDWEYPAIAGYPGHPYTPADKVNFTELVVQLRKTLGKNAEISFAAGGFMQFLEQSIEWKKVMAVASRVYLMTYDLVHGYSTATGHHTPLYSTSYQKESADNAIRYFDSIEIPRNKLVIGVGFYARVFEGVESINDGLYQPGKFKRGVPYKAFEKNLSADSGFVYHWDDVAKAPYLYNAQQKLFVTFDDTTSIQHKTTYAIQKKLNGIMFWQLDEDKFTGGLLDAIDKVKKK